VRNIAGLFWDLRYIIVLCFSIQWLVFVFHAAPNRSQRYYDATGAVTYWLAVLLSYAIGGNVLRVSRPQIISLCVLLWCTRLGFFLHGRIVRDQKDKHFRSSQKNLLHYFGVWTFQGSWCVLVGLPAYLSNMQHTPQPDLGVGDLLGLILFVVGWGTEVLADHQKDRFRNVEANRKRFINTGLWAWSRHPNYFGEILLWCGLALSASHGLQGIPQAVVWLSPLFTLLLLGWLSGIPMLEEYADNKWGFDPSYHAYKATTNVLLPWPPAEDLAQHQTKMLKRSYSGGSPTKPAIPVSLYGE